MRLRESRSPVNAMRTAAKSPLSLPKHPWTRQRGKTVELERIRDHLDGCVRGDLPEFFAGAAESPDSD